MTVPPLQPVSTLRIDVQKQLHPRQQIRLRGFEQRVAVVFHQGPPHAPASQIVRRPDLTNIASHTDIVILKHGLAAVSTRLQIASCPNCLISQKSGYEKN